MKKTLNYFGTAPSFLLKSIKIVFLPLTVLLLFGCSSDKLSRNEAAKAILIKEQLPSDEIRSIDLYYEEEEFVTVYDSSNDIRKQSEQESRRPEPKVVLTNLQNDGLITYKIEIVETETINIWAAPGVYDFYSLKPGFEGNTVKRLHTKYKYVHHGDLTEKGKKYEISPGNFLLAKMEFGEITGIIENKEFNVAEVNYTVKRTNVTPFGNYFYDLPEETFNRKATFIKYDDGWRINMEK